MRRAGARDRGRSQPRGLTLAAHDAVPPHPSARVRAMSWRQPRSLHARQLLAASLGLVAFLALAGFALDRAFLETAESNLRERLKNYAWPTRPRSSSPATASSSRPTNRRTRASSGPAAACTPRSCCRSGHWDSPSAQGPTLPAAPMLDARAGALRRPAAVHRRQRRCRRGLPLRLRPDLERRRRAATPSSRYTIYIYEDTTALSRQVARVPRARCGATSAAPALSCCWCRCWCCAGACGRCGA